ncbi:MAG: RNA polymerase sigma factor [Candidatus Xenobia bacterium]
MRELDDAALSERCLSATPGAWEELYRRYAGRIRGVIGWSRWGFSGHEVEDFVQEVFLELARALPGWRGEATLQTFVMRLARNKCVSHLRRVTAQKRGTDAVTVSLDEPKRPGEDARPQATAVDPAPTPEAAMVQQDEVRILLGGLDQLSGDCQRIIRLRYYDEMAYEDICRNLELPLGTVCSRLKRCLDRLRVVVTTGITG